MNIGLVCQRLEGENLALYNALRAGRHDVTHVIPQHLRYFFPRGGAARVWAGDTDLVTSLPLLVVRGTTNREAETALLVRTLTGLGGLSCDPVERFGTYKASKLFTTLTRWQTGYGTSSYVAFRRDTASALLAQLRDTAHFPLVAKPIAGRRGEGIVKLSDWTAAEAYVRACPADEHGDLREPLLLQDCVDFAREYRVLLVGGQVLACVRKHKPRERFDAERARGARFEASALPAELIPAIQSVSQVGLLGVDLGVDRQGGVHVIEENRAPEWDHMAEAMGTNIATRLANLIAPPEPEPEPVVVVPPPVAAPAAPDFSDGSVLRAQLHEMIEEFLRQKGWV